jgi:hypothetical protein
MGKKITRPEILCVLGVMALAMFAGCEPTPQPPPTGNMIEESRVRVHGVVLERRTNRPAPYAVISIGNPKSAYNVATIPVGPDGRFDFMISGIDQSRVFLWNGQHGSKMLFTRIDRAHMRSEMVLYMPEPTMVSGHGISNEFFDPWGH